MSVKCIVPVRLFGELAGEYHRDRVYPNDRLAAVEPTCFEAVPDPGTEGAAPSRDAELEPARPEKKPTRRK